MEVIGVVVGVAVLGLLAVRFAHDRHGGGRSKVEVLAIRGGSRCDLARRETGAASAAREPYPTLAFIERAIGGAGLALTSSPHASELEARASALTREYWSDSVWTTGAVSAAAFRRVLDELAPGLGGVGGAVEPVHTADTSPSGASVAPVAGPQPAGRAAA